MIWSPEDDRRFLLLCPDGIAAFTDHPLNTMAEILGLVPIVLETASLVKKLRDYCHGVHTAREDIQGLSDEVESLHVVLHQIENVDFQIIAVELSAIRKCHADCSRANETLSAVVKELDHGLGARRLRTLVIYPLQKEKIKQLTEKLRRAKDSLRFACDAYMLCLIVSQQQQIQSLEAYVHENLQDLPARIVRASQAKSKNDAHRSGRHSDDSTGWLNVIWSALTRGTFSAWHRPLRCDRDVDLNSEAFEAVQTGNLVELQRLICSGEATLYDVQSEYASSTLLTASYDSALHSQYW